MANIWYLIPSIWLKNAWHKYGNGGAFFKLITFLNNNFWLEDSNKYLYGFLVFLQFKELLRLNHGESDVDKYPILTGKMFTILFLQRSTWYLYNFECENILLIIKWWNGINISLKTHTIMVLYLM